MKDRESETVKELEIRPSAWRIQRKTGEREVAKERGRVR
jgi:hypothetical protein